MYNSVELPQWGNSDSFSMTHCILYYNFWWWNTKNYRKIHIILYGCIHAFAWGGGLRKVSVLLGSIVMSVDSWSTNFLTAGSELFSVPRWCVQILERSLSDLGFPLLQLLEGWMLVKYSGTGRESQNLFMALLTMLLASWKACRWIENRKLETHTKL